MPMAPMPPQATSPRPDASPQSDKPPPRATMQRGRPTRQRKPIERFGSQPDANRHKDASALCGAATEESFVSCADGKKNRRRQVGGTYPTWTSRAIRSRSDANRPKAVSALCWATAKKSLVSCVNSQKSDADRSMLLTDVEEGEFAGPGSNRFPMALKDAYGKDPVSTTYQEELCGPDRELFEEETVKAMKKLEGEHKTWKTASIHERKARNSVRGDRKVEGVDDTEWYLHVASWSTVHKMLYLRFAQAPLFWSNHINGVQEAGTALGLDVSKPAILHSTVFDNNGTLSLALSPKISPRTKHIAVKNRNFRESVGAGKGITIFKIDTKLQRAVILTKGLPDDTHQRAAHVVDGLVIVILCVLDWIGFYGEPTSSSVEQVRTAGLGASMPSSNERKWNDSVQSLVKWDCHVIAATARKHHSRLSSQYWKLRNVNDIVVIEAEGADLPCS